MGREKDVVGVDFFGMAYGLEDFGSVSGFGSGGVVRRICLSSYWWSVVVDA